MSVNPVQVIRPGRGRPSKVETEIVNSLVWNAETLQSWQLRNKRVATGKSVNSYKVVVTRPNTKFGRQFGIVNGKITAAAHTKFALQGRKGGGFPPVAAIEAWIDVKKIKSKKVSKKQLAWLIARKIATEGTNPPHFTENIQTKITKASARRTAIALRKPLAAAMGKKWVRELIKHSETWENISFNSKTVTDDGSDDY